MAVNNEVLKKRYKNLKALQNKSEAEIQDIINKKGLKAVEVAPSIKLDVDTLFTSKEEIKLAKELEKKYISEYNIESVSDKNLLYYLIYLEVLHITKLQKSANEFQSTNEAIPTAILDALHKNLVQIISIREKLGLNKDKEVVNDAFLALETLKKKFKVWRENNQASRTIVCPFCSKMVMLKIRTEAWEAQKHPFFKDRFIGNEHLIRLYKEQKLSKEDVALILGVSADYVDWLVKKWNVDVNQGLSAVSPTEKSEPVASTGSNGVSPFNDLPEVDSVTQ